jgi:hypothetical protein
MENRLKQVIVSAKHGAWRSIFIGNEFQFYIFIDHERTRPTWSEKTLSSFKRMAAIF